MFFTCFFQMLALAILILVGYLVGRKQMADNHTMTQISALIGVLFNPMLLISSAISSMHSVELSSWFLLLLFVIAMFLVFIALSYLFAPFFDRRKGQKEMYQMMFVFGNFGYMGIPVVKGVYGEEYTVYVLAFIFAFNLFFYTFGVTIMSGGFSLKSLKGMLNTGTLSCLVAVLLLLFKPDLPSFLTTAVEYLGSVTSPLAMLAVGITVAGADLKAIFTNPKMYLFTLLRMILIPLVSIPIIHLLPFDATVLGIILIEIGMPVANMTLVIGTEKGVDCSNCSASIIMTTLLSVLTIPVLLTLI